jgi:hypothetical protein
MRLAGEPAGRITLSRPRFRLKSHSIDLQAVGSATLRGLKAKNTSVSRMVQAGIVNAKGGKYGSSLVNLLPPAY